MLEPAGLDFQVLSTREILIRPKPEDTRREEGQMVLRGQVVDALSGAPLPYAAIIAEVPFTGAEADENGAFTLRLAPVQPL